MVAISVKKRMILLEKVSIGADKNMEQGYLLWQSIMCNGSVMMFWRQSIMEKFIEGIRNEGFESRAL
ncbi:hypothetical protein [Paenibacillus alba]|uniref:Uncharacterized protein n=1 Tax=Paenibacillus alba TaxID=1197127 RepID=A0ABU6FXW7_9BACL|nr:hypothetical protein [Paenibacillus alba]MEC0226751.1 hypothetical protein [Paenibacillus alba]